MTVLTPVLWVVGIFLTVLTPFPWVVKNALSKRKLYNTKQFEHNTIQNLATCGSAKIAQEIDRTLMLHGINLLRHNIGLKIAEYVYVYILLVCL